jgi:glycosidase
MLAEAEAAELHHEAFDMTYNWHFMGVMNRIGKGEDDILDLDEYFKWEKETFTRNDYRMNFTSNHDENSWKGTAFERLGESTYPFTVLTATMNGMPLVYSGQEAGLNERLEFFEKDTIEWKEHKLEDMYTKLFHLKKENRALWNGTEGGEMMRVDTGDDPDVFAFVREKNGDKVFTILNFSEKEKSMQVNDEKIKGNYTELFTEKEKSFKESEKINLKPWDYKVFHN